MTFKKTLCICASALMLLSVGAIGANASSNNVKKPPRITRHLNNVRRNNHVNVTFVESTVLNVI